MRPSFHNQFTPARRDSLQTLDASHTPIEFVIELFVGFSDSELRDFFMEHYSVSKRRDGLTHMFSLS